MVKKLFLMAVVVSVFTLGTKGVLAEVSVSASSGPLISITSVTDPSVLPNGESSIIFVHKIINQGTVPLSEVTVVDSKCSAMSGELGDTNGNHLLDMNEVWTYTCATALATTTGNIATVTAYANGVKATVNDTIVVNVATPTSMPSPSLPNNGFDPGNLNVTAIVWGTLGMILAALIIIFFVTRKKA